MKTQLGEFTDEEVIQKVELVVDANSTFVYKNHYQQCIYYSGNKPMCLVGCALDSFLTEAEKERIRQECNTDTVTDMFLTLGIDFSDRLVGFLSTVQFNQDTGDSWGEALAEGEKYLAKYQ